jgi:hypothetical protein
VLVDKIFNEKKKKNHSDTKSVFSIGDYRHNLIFKNEADSYSSKVNQMPKQFFDWDNGLKFNPKYKRDKIMK